MSLNYGWKLLHNKWKIRVLGILSSFKIGFIKYMSGVGEYYLNYELGFILL